MTRDEFIQNVTTWSELRSFCYDYECSVCSEVYSQDELDDYFNERLVDMARDASDWSNLLESLEDIPTGASYYIRDDDGDFSEADESDFDDLKDEVLEWADYEEVFDDCDEDEEDYDDEEEPEPFVEEDPDDRYEVGNEEMSIAELFTAPQNGSRGIYNV